MSAIDDLAYNGILDTRTIDERIAELASLEADPDDGRPDDDLSEDDRDELNELRSFRDAVRGYCADWDYGETIIADWAFEEYAQELAVDIGAVQSDYSWPASHIDWTAAADALRQDYTCVEDADGRTWWTR